MQLAHPRLDGVEGLKFHRLMGSGGGNGFGLSPNWGVYALVSHWENDALATSFFSSDPWFREVTARTIQRITFRLEATMTHGEWGGTNPFTPRPERYDASQPVAVITRATIRPRKLFDFWRYVPQASASVYDQASRLLSIGIGEYPVFMQATFSLWTSGQAMTRFAYSGERHREVVKLTRERDWYREELFTRFRICGVQGEWNGLDLSAIEQAWGPQTNPPAGNVKVGPE